MLKVIQSKAKQRKKIMLRNKMEKKNDGRKPIECNYIVSALEKGHEIQFFCSPLPSIFRFVVNLCFCFCFSFLFISGTHLNPAGFTCRRQCQIKNAIIKRFYNNIFNNYMIADKNGRQFTANRWQRMQRITTFVDEIKQQQKQFYLLQ